MVTEKANFTVPKSPETTDVGTSAGTDLPSREHVSAFLGMCSITTNSDTARIYSEALVGAFDLREASSVLRENVKQLRSDDELLGAQSMLAAQAVALNSIFNRLAKQAATNIGHHPGACDTYLRLALKAQSQCRTTLETLAEVKHPKSATFIRQANVGQNVQVNNGTQLTGNPVHAHEKNIMVSNELLREEHAHAAVDTRRTGAAGEIDTHMEAVETVNRAGNSRGKKACKQ